MMDRLVARIYEHATGRAYWTHTRPVNLKALNVRLGPHLAIASTNDPRWPHTFRVVHSPTGRPLVGGAGCITCCARAALAVAATDADWYTLRADNAAAWLAAASPAVQQVIADYRLGMNCFAGPGGRACDPDGTDVADEDLALAGAW